MNEQVDWRHRWIRILKEHSKTAVARVEGREVRIKRRGNAIVLEPIPDSWAWLDDLPRPLDEDFVEAAREQPPTPERPGLDKLFR